MSRHHSSLAAPPLDNEDLLQEILLRIPLKPSSFPRASLVCKRWRSILSDPRFLRRFRKHHRTPSLLGFFDKEWHQAPVFTPMLDPPDRIPAASFALPENLHGLELWTTLGRRHSLSLHGCRHGIALFLDRNRREAVLWYPLTDVQRRVAFPPGLDCRHIWNAAALHSAGDDQLVHGDCHLSPFKLVLVCHDPKYTKASICMYESKVGVWGDIISTATTDVTRHRPSVLVGNALCWLLGGGNILKFDCEKLTLAVIEKPADVPMLLVLASVLASTGAFGSYEERITTSALPFCQIQHGAFSYGRGNPTVMVLSRGFYRTPSKWMSWSLFHNLHAWEKWS